MAKSARPAGMFVVGRSTYLLAGLLTLLLLYPYLLEGTFEQRLIIGFLNVAILVAAARVATATWHAFVAVVVFLGLPSLGLQAAYLVTNNALIGELLPLIYMVFYLFTIGHVLRYVLAPGQVTGDKIQGAIAAYILIGLVWATLYVLIDRLHPGSFTDSARGNVVGDAEAEDLLYFSFVTLTTTGYGDVAPVSAHARSLAILEQLAGTFYIAILIARLTGLYQGRARRGTDPE
jgi:Ion channel